MNGPEEDRTTSVRDLLESKACWLYVAPVHGLHLGKGVNYEYRVDRVQFIPRQQLVRRRRRLGFPVAVSQLRPAGKKVFDVLAENETFAVARHTGTGDEVRRTMETLITEELAILSASQLGYGRRRFNAAPEMGQGMGRALSTDLLINVANMSWVEGWRVKRTRSALELDEGWSRFQAISFFGPLIKIIRGETKVTASWRRDLRNAAILVGQSQCSKDPAVSLLWNMIALEILLTQEHDRVKYSEALPSRVGAFIGWADEWKAGGRERLEGVYKKRCTFVHRGWREHIEVQDVLFSDQILFNVLLNICLHPRLFCSKEKVIEFSKMVEAEMVLGIQKPRVRPKTLQIMRPTYFDEDFERL